MFPQSARVALAIVSLTGVQDTPALGRSEVGSQTDSARNLMSSPDAISGVSRTFATEKSPNSLPSIAPTPAAYPSRTLTGSSGIIQIVASH